MSEQGIVFNIQRFSLNDGPGIRTTVFFKGCPLRCAWCHNPEGLSPRPEVLYTPEHCIGCGACVAACPQGCHRMEGGLHRFVRAACTGCGQCAAACGSLALEACGRVMDASAVLAEVERDLPFYEEEGGLTLSGGEPLMQSAFAVHLLLGARRLGVHSCVETSGAAPEAQARPVLELADLVLLDVKHTDGAQLRQYTGADPRQIEVTYRLLQQLGKPVVLRCPIIPGVNDVPGHFDAVARLARKFTNIQAVELMPYHSLGEAKRTRLGRGSGGQFRVPSAEEAEQWRAHLAKRLPGLSVRLG